MDRRSELNGSVLTRGKRARTAAGATPAFPAATSRAPSVGSPTTAVPSPAPERWASLHAAPTTSVHQRADPVAGSTGWGAAAPSPPSGSASPTTAPVGSMTSPVGS